MNVQKPEYVGFNQPEVEQDELEVEDVKEKLVYWAIVYSRWVGQRSGNETGSGFGTVNSTK